MLDQTPDEPQVQPYANVEPRSPDDQSREVYHWEDKVFPDSSCSYLNLRHAQEFVDEIWADFNLVGPAPKILDGRGSKDARTWGDTISLPKGLRNFTVMIHELAHCISGLLDWDDSCNHGKMFMHVYLTMMTRYCNHKYQVLAESAIKDGIEIQRIKIKTRLKPFAIPKEPECQPESSIKSTNSDCHPL